MRVLSHCGVPSHAVLLASLDGSISSLVPAKDAVHKRLQLVQTRLTRHIQHFAGLNPKGHRFVMISASSLVLGLSPLK
jgi:cleavage and polyadenylation specificity factor subunit 1